MKILIADDSRTNLAILKSSLTDLGHVVMAADSGEQAIVLFNQERPDLIILDVVMKEMNGFECARQIRAIDSEDWIPIIFLSGDVNDTSIAKGIDAGGDDYLTKPFSEITLAAKIKAMQRISDMRKKLFELSDKLAALSITDSLTGLYNRLQFDTALTTRLAEANRYQDNVALLFLDLDKFKQVNDTLGHQYGDLLLKQVSERLKSSIRKNDFIARLGGDEFAILISRFETPSAIETVAAKLVSLASEPYILNDKKVNIGVSVGIAIHPSHGISAETLIRKADTAMYEVKKTGRNNYLFYSENMDSVDEDTTTE